MCPFAVQHEQKHCDFTRPYNLEFYLILGKTGILLSATFYESLEHESLLWKGVTTQSPHKRCVVLNLF